MILIIGGAYQGKKALARQKYGLTENDIYTCTGSEIDLNYPCIDSLEKFSYCCVLEDKDPIACLDQHLPLLQDKILICRDIFSGVVPVDKNLRIWRETTGRMCQFLAANAESVIRVFCGLEQVLK